MRWLCLILLFCFSTLSFAQEVTVANTKTKGVVIPTQASIDAKNNKKFLIDFLTWLRKATQNPQAVSKEEINHYFDSHVVYIINEKNVAYSTAQLLARFYELGKQYHSMSLILPPNSIIVAGNHAGIHYQIGIENKQGQRYRDDVLAILTLKKNKIIKWRAIVAHDDVS